MFYCAWVRSGHPTICCYFAQGLLQSLHVLSFTQYTVQFTVLSEGRERDGVMVSRRFAAKHKGPPVTVKVYI